TGVQTCALPILSVLTAWNVMRALHELERDGEGWVWLDRRRTTRFRLDEKGLVTAAERSGRPVEWVSCVDVEQHPEGGSQVFWATPGTMLKTVCSPCTARRPRQWRCSMTSRALSAPSV